VASPETRPVFRSMCVCVCVFACVRQCSCGRRALAAARGSVSAFERKQRGQHAAPPRGRRWRRRRARRPQRHRRLLVRHPPPVARTRVAPHVGIQPARRAWRAKAFGQPWAPGLSIGRVLRYQPLQLQQARLRCHRSRPLPLRLVHQLDDRRPVLRIDGAGRHRARGAAAHPLGASQRRLRVCTPNRLLHLCFASRPHAVGVAAGDHGGGSRSRASLFVVSPRFKLGQPRRA
jgi:hypothetical protein